jgi:hypothetical protein
MGRFPEGTPATIRVARKGRPRSVEEFVDYHGVKDDGMRQLLIDYISQRAALGMDYSSLRGLIGHLVRNFWCVIERINPEQHDLDLDETTYEAWRKEVGTIETPDGPRPRQGIWDLLIAVRALYLDLQTWALEDPGRWGPWSARCPIPPVASHGYSAGRRRQAERIADRTRTCQPLLSHLVRHASSEKERLRAFRTAATASLHEPADRERVIPMSPELLHVIAELIRRHTDGLEKIPLVRRWDPHARQHSEPLPYLFQRTKGPVRGVLSAALVAKLLRRACAAAAKDHPEFDGLTFTPHDFRRIFATDLVNNGLPIHIGAALLGHANLQTTRGYVAVFDEDVVRHYQIHMAQRRALRPDHEYNKVTNEEWAEFEEHFDKSAKSSSAPAADPTARPAHTNTPASAVPCCTSNHE